MIDFLDTDPDVITTALVQKYEQLAGRTLQPAQAERIVINAIAYRLAVMYEQVNHAANQCLVAFAVGNALDELGKLVGVRRLNAAPATCIVRLQLVPGHGDLSIPAGIRIQSVDGQAVFSTIETKNVLAATNTVDVKAECLEPGIIGNGYAIGNVSVILDPKPYISAAANIDASANGIPTESDDAVRERIQLAPSSFSVAGPKGAYKYFAKTAHPAIIDVEVLTGRQATSPFNIIPGQVDIFPLMADGSDPDTEVSDAILAQCNVDTIRPLTDTVVVKAPQKLEYAIEVELTLLPTAVQSTVEAAVNDALLTYANRRKKKLGIDVVLSQIIALCQVSGVYDTVIIEPSADITAATNQFTWCTGITVTTSGTSDE